MPDGFGGEFNDDRFQVLDIGAGCLEEVINIGILTEDFKGSGDLVKGRWGRCAPRLIDIIPGDTGEGLLPIVGQAVTDNLDEGQDLEDGRVLDDGLDDSFKQDIIG